MRITVSEAARQLDERGLLERERQDYSEQVIERVSDLLGQPLPSDLMAFYRERISGLGDFTAMAPHWNERVGWRSPDKLVTRLLHANAVPIFDDGCGNFFGLDLTAGETPAVYFFDHEREYEKPEYAAGSSIGAFLLLLADHDKALREGWPDRWELKIDPDIDKCPRAPAIWDAG